MGHGSHHSTKFYRERLQRYFTSHGIFNSIINFNKLKIINKFIWEYKGENTQPTTIKERYICR